jgi:hypothetical protein
MSTWPISRELLIFSWAFASSLKQIAITSTSRTSSIS